MTGAFTTRYADHEREAIIAAYVDRGMRPAQLVADLAAAGKLELNGERIDPFKIPTSTVRSIARDARRRGERLASQLEVEPPRDELEAHRRRLVAAIDHAMTAVERRQRAGEPVKGEELRQLARAMRELAAIPGPSDPRPPAPGAKVNGVRDGGETRGGIAGSLLADHRRDRGGAWPAVPALSAGVADETTAQIADHDGEDEPGDSPVAFVRSELELLSGDDGGEPGADPAAAPGPPPPRREYRDYFA